MEPLRHRLARLLLVIPIGASIVTLVSGAYYFERSSQRFADYI